MAKSEADDPSLNRINDIISTIAGHPSLGVSDCGGEEVTERCLAWLCFYCFQTEENRAVLQNSFLFRIHPQDYSRAFQ